MLETKVQQMFTTSWISKLCASQFLAQMNLKSLELFEEWKHVFILVFMSTNYRVWKTRIHPRVRDFTENYPESPCLASERADAGAGEVFPGDFLPSFVAHGNMFLFFNPNKWVCQHQVSQRESSASCGLNTQSLKDQDQVSVQFDSWSTSCSLCSSSLAKQWIMTVCVLRLLGFFSWTL